MADVTSIEQRLHETHVHLDALAGALARADVGQLEQLATQLSATAHRLRHCEVAGVQPAGTQLARAVAELSWQLERCRRLGRTFQRIAHLPVPGYEPDGRSRQVPAPAPTIEVLG